MCSAEEAQTEVNLSFQTYSSRSFHRNMKLRKQNKHGHVGLLKALQTYYNQSISRMEQPWRRHEEPQSQRPQCGMGCRICCVEGCAWMNARAPRLMHVDVVVPTQLSLPRKAWCTAQMALPPHPQAPRQPLKDHNGRLDGEKRWSRLSWLNLLPDSSSTPLFHPLPSC